MLASYDWPGNFHELARVIDHAHGSGRGEGSWVDVLDLPVSIRGNQGAAYLPPPIPSPIKPLDQLLTEVEQRSIERALKQARGNKSRAADLLGISRPRLYRRIKELDLPDDGEIRRWRRTRKLTRQHAVRRGKAERAPSHPCSGAFRRSPFYLSVSETLTIREHRGKEYKYPRSPGSMLAR